MEQNIILSGVGGQGILSMSYMICQAALEKNWNVKQSEVHGMAQRGGAVSSHLRLSPKPIASDLIAKGDCTLLISVEPLEATRYLDFLAPTAAVVTSMTPYKNIPDYPDLAKVWEQLDRVHNLVPIDAEPLAKKAGSSLAQNTVLLGAASLFLDFPAALLEAWLEKTWKAKGDRIVATNLEAFRNGRKMAAFLSSLSAESAPAEGIRFLSKQVPIEKADPARASSWTVFLTNHRPESWAEKIQGQLA
ncbi:MAG: indolepyruvate oxidoreductase subunit beta [Pseudomonadota bacterium]